MAQAQAAAAPAVQTGSAYWRAAGMTYIGFANLCAVVVRKCQKEPFKSQSLSREKVHYKYAPYADGAQQKPEYRGVDAGKEIG
ncbi:hypothetical protein M758_9G079200 [Ceratodon purpureus]|uniref:ATP synthase subunit epsilon, mitochondrial n=1 Tax=Ceratodon purpureus TaxID=3225 RepID=A0A8T0GXJ9_CERPU|nr:hypothetical protein KC19_9G175100 [Ceratodon purpureus]KAG0605677.1 hypothetical protein M758_9G079200 [Ceratodon purpureus]